MVVSWESRLSALNSWLEGFNQVLGKTRDPELGALDRFLDEHSSVIEPSPDGEPKLLDRAGVTLKPPVFYLTVVFPGDEVCGEVWAWVLQKERLGAFHLPRNLKAIIQRETTGEILQEIDLGLIILRAELQLSSLWKGLYLAHEIKHRKNHVKYGPDLMRFRREQGVEERDVYAFQHRLMALLGDRAYKEALKAAVAYVLEETKRYGKKPGEAFPLRFQDNHGLLDQAFGPAASEAERSYRQLQLSIHAGFTVVDRYCQGNKEWRKAEFMKAFHEGAFD